LKTKKHNGPAKRKIKILIVDDLEFPRMIIRNMLQDLGYESHNNILEAANGLEAFDVMKEEQIDLIICDWTMPIMTGFELLQKIRATPELAKTPFIMLTAAAEKENILGAIKAGVSQYIVKPFTAETLYQKIEASFAGPR
jgi:two-component system chemotaxis response regulator CheY